MSSRAAPAESASETKELDSTEASAPSAPPEPEERRVLEGWIGTHQSPNGAWEAAGFHRWRGGERVGADLEGLGRAENDVAVTSLALLAYLGTGYGETSAGPHGAAIHWALRWLESVQGTDGGFRPIGARGWALNHAIATHAVSSAARNWDGWRIVRCAQRAIDFALASLRRGDEAWRTEDGPGGLPPIVWLMLAFHGADPLRTRDASARLAVPPDVVASLQDEVGRWSETSADPARNAAAILARLFAGEDPRRSDPVVSAAERCEAGLPVWAAVDPRMDFGTWYFGTLAMYQVGGERWKRWNGAMKTAIVDTQRRDGTRCGYKQSWDPLDRWGPEGGRVYSSAILDLCLSVYYRYDRVMCDDPGAGRVPPPPTDHSARRVYAPCE